MKCRVTLYCSSVPRLPNASDWKPPCDLFDQPLKSVVKSRRFTKRKCFGFVLMWKKRDGDSAHVYARCKVSLLLLTPLHGLRKLSLQRAAFPRSITGPFRSSHPGLLAGKLCWYGFQQAGGRNEAAFHKTWIITRFTLIWESSTYCGGRVCVHRWPLEEYCGGRLQHGSPEAA